MEELFRFIQQSVVVPTDVGQLDLTTDSPFQDDLRALIESGRPQGGLWRIDGSELCIRVIGGDESCCKDIVKIDAKSFLIDSSKTIYRLVE